jgi:molybdate transport system substrate-binding protein
MKRRSGPVHRVWPGAFALFALFAARASATEVRVAVAANFTETAKELASVFQKQTSHAAVLSFGASGQLLTQVQQGAPFEVLLSADRERPEQAVALGLAVADSRFTYAIGKLVLFGKSAELVRGEGTLEGARFTKLAIAKPETAPYGAAAIEVLKALGLHAALTPKLVQGNSIAQAYQFIETGNAELGFVSLSQVMASSAGSRWVVPQNLYTPIRQDAVLLKNGADSAAAREFLVFLKSPAARAMIEKYGYGIEGGAVEAAAVAPK